MATRKRRIPPPRAIPGNARPHDFKADLEAAAALLAHPLGQDYVRMALRLWGGLGQLVAKLQWATMTHKAVIALALACHPDVSQAVAAVLGPAPPDARPREVLLAYLTRTGKRPDAGFAGLAADMELTCLYLYAVQELDRRMAQHPIATLLFAAAALIVGDVAVYVVLR